ncbi:hypothetical protein BSKO_12968 [Bryopsis sp. KO-2023]|nr:hypothetical protein BSKO_12968 [Bryopsis sp. KO-2023]
MSYYDAYQTAGLSLPDRPPEIQNWQQTVGLTQQEPDYMIDGSIKEVAMGLGWDAGCDVDGSVAMFDERHQLLDTVWYRQLMSRDSSVNHSGDDTTGEGGGDDEVIQVNLAKLNGKVHHLLFVVCVYTAGMSFSQVRSAYVRMMHGKKKHKGHVLARFNLSERAGNAMLMGLLTRKGAFWNFRALGYPAQGRTIMQVINVPQNLHCLAQSPSFSPVIRRIHIIVREGRNLAIKDKKFFGKGGSSDPYVQIKFQKQKVKSDVIKKNLNPKWNMPAFDLGNVLESEHKAVKISVWDYDLGGDDFMGVLRIPAAAFHKAGPGNHEWWMPLTKSKESRYAKCEVKGEVRIDVSVVDVK